MKLSLIIPAYNEARTLPTVLEHLFSLNLDLDVIVVDDGSTDETEHFFHTWSHPAVRYVRRPENSGKGAAVRDGMSLAEGEIIGILDADLEYDPRDITRLLEPFSSGALVVYGSRILRPENTMSYRRYYFGGRFLTAATNFLYGSRLTDEPTGYKFFKTSLLRNLDLECTGFEFCPEVTGKLLRSGIPILEVPVSYHPRSFEEGKKIHWKDGVIALITLLKYRFGKITWKKGGPDAGQL